jgi:DivIVA domain-containing protein
MALSLDDVRNKRFRMARKSGYEVLEVDEFVDEVEATFEQLFEENQNLKKQVEALKATGRPTAQDAQAPAATPTPAAVSAPPVDSRPTERIVVTTGKEASTAVVRLVELSTEQAERLAAEAEAEAAQIREQANAAAAEVTSEAQARAEEIEAEVRGRSESLEREIEDRRSHLVGELEEQRDALTATVLALRDFEATYRANLTRHLQSQIEALESGTEEPADPPAALAAASANRDSAAAQDGPAPQAAGSADTSAGDSPAGGQSETPRLDALLGDQR